MQVIDLNASITERYSNNPNGLITRNEPVMIDGLKFGSTIAINGPDTDRFPVTDNAVTLAFDTRGYYRLKIIGPGARADFCFALSVV